MALTGKQKLHIQEYLVDLDAKASAIRAGYSLSWAKSKAAQALAKPAMAAALTEAMAERSKRTEITQDWVLANLKEVAERCMQAVPVTRFDKDKRESVETGEWEFDSTGANRSLELIGKHLGMFKEKVEHSGAVGPPEITLIINETPTAQ